MTQSTTADRWQDCDLAVVDVETTGLDPRNDRIIEIAVIHMRGGETIESWGRLIDPGIPIPEDVVKLTGITQAQVDGQPRFEALAAEIRARLEGKVAVAYNLPFDRGFITAELERAGTTWPDVPALDPLVFARELQKEAGSKRLGSVAERLGIELKEAHRATDDARVAGLVLYAFRGQIPDRLEELVALQQVWSQRQERELAARRRRRGGEDAFAELQPKASGPVGDGTLIALGPAYVYGDEPDPIRFFYKQLPDIGARR